MPTYEYKCQSCKRRFEVVQSMSDKPLTECGECHGPVKRLIGTGAGFLFKGSGFYVTDYRSESYKQAEKRAAADTGAPKTPAAPAPATGTTAASTSDGSTGATEKKKP
jgi:putative FmdB family regulatory protein